MPLRLGIDCLGATSISVRAGGAESNERGSSDKVEESSVLNSASGVGDTTLSEDITSFEKTVLNLSDEELSKLWT